MREILYRFRKIENLLGRYKELESQTIFFAAPKILNDPMEGFRDLFWSGDDIIWENLFRHYLLCFEDAFQQFIANGETIEISDSDITVYKSFNDLSPQIYKDFISEIYVEFFSNLDVSRLISKICSRSSKIRRDELYFYLTIIHSFATEMIYSKYIDKGYVDKNVRTEEQGLDMRRNAEQRITHIVDSGFIELIEETASVGNDENSDRKVKALFNANRKKFTQFTLSGFYNKRFDISQKNKFLIFMDFPAKYISALEQLLYPNWYTACFMKTCTNSSVWGNYGGNHEGVCMIFETDDRFCLPLRDCKDEESKARFNYDSYKFYKIDYQQGFGEVDFFRTIGRIPIPQLNSTWYLNPKTRTLSVCADQLINNIDEWRDNYWKNFYRDITIKSKDWDYENEYRLIISEEMSYNSLATNGRKLEYKFSALKGIIFGINTKTEDKLAIISIIKNKCKENNIDSFGFHQAYYSEEKKEVSYYSLNID